MRIGMLADVYKPHVSGITHYIELNKKYLEGMGHEVFVFTFGEENYPDDEPGIIRSPGLPLLDTGYFLNLRYRKQARKLLYTMDVVHVHHPFLSGSLALRYCHPHGIPVIFTNHTRYDLYARAYMPVVADLIGVPALEAYMPSFCRACDLVISPSAGMRDVLTKLGVTTPVEIVPNGVDLLPFSSSLQPVDRARLGFTPEDVVLIYVGRIGPEKNLPFLLRSFAGTAQAFDHVRLLLVGGGAELDNLQDRARLMGIVDQVHFTGMVPYHEIPSYLVAADAFVTASVTEVHPLSVIEAMAAGLPVLGIHSPGVSDTVESGETGFLVPEEDLAAFTARMVRLVTDAEERRAMGEKARQAAKKYSIERTSQIMLEHYTTVTRQAQGNKNSLRARWQRLRDEWSQ